LSNFFDKYHLKILFSHTCTRKQNTYKNNTILLRYDESS